MGGTHFIISVIIVTNRELSTAHKTRSMDDEDDTITFKLLLELNCIAINEFLNFRRHTFLFSKATSKLSPKLSIYIMGLCSNFLPPASSWYQNWTSDSYHGSRQYRMGQGNIIYVARRRLINTAK